MNIRRLAVLLWAAGFSLAAAMLVPVVFECFDKYTNAETIKSGLIRAAAILAVTSLLAPWTSLQFDFPRRVVRWRRRRFFSTHSKQFNYESVLLVECVQRPKLPSARRNVLRIQTENGLLKTSLGWSLGDESQRRVDRLVSELRRRLQLPESSVESDDLEPPRAKSRRQLSLRRLMLATLAGAVVLSIARLSARSTPDAALPGGLAAALMAAAAVLWFRWGEPAIERLLTLLAIAYLPFAWVAEVSWPFGRTSGMWAPFLFIPNSFIATHLLYRANNAVSLWIAAGVTLCEFALMTWCAIRGWKWTLAAAIILGLFSCFCSFGFYAGYRM